MLETVASLLSFLIFSLMALCAGKWCTWKKKNLIKLASYQQLLDKNGTALKLSYL